MKKAMPQLSYSEIADKTIRNFLKAVVLIDDHWAEAQSAPGLIVEGTGHIDLVPQTIPPQGQEQELLPVQEAPPPGAVSLTDPVYLREIGDEIIKEGLLFTGFTYVDAHKETAFKLASKSDILILDWLLGGGDCRPALDLLAGLKETGSPKFIFILTDEGLDGVRARIIEELGEPTGGTGYVFNCGQFSFSLKNKAQKGGDNCVIASRVLSEAISGIATRYGGLLQLAALELLGHYRNCLHEVLDHFHSNTDFPFILEWLEGASPIKDSHSFNALAIDEWTAKVLRRFHPSKSIALTDSTVSACLKNWHKTTVIPEDAADKLKKLVKDEKIYFPQTQLQIDELMESLDEWLETSSINWPEALGGEAKGSPWGEKKRQVLAMHYLGVRKGVNSVTDSLITLDALFQCQANLPSKIEQGTVLRTIDGKYLICITPACDCERPSTRINNCFMFLEAIKLEKSMIKKSPEGYVVAIRTVDNENMLLGVSPKPTFTYKIPNPLIDSCLIAYATYGYDTFFGLKPVAQLRSSRIQALISLTAGKAIEVGLDRSELLRKLCEENK